MDDEVVVDLLTKEKECIGTLERTLIVTHNEQWIGTVESVNGSQ